MKKTLIQILIEVLILLAAIVVFAQQTEHPKEFPQIGFSVIEGSGEMKTITPTENYISILGIVPADPMIYYAPLNQGDKMICRMYDGITETGQRILGLRCGTYNYYVKTLAITEKKK